MAEYYRIVEEMRGKELSGRLVVLLVDAKCYVIQWALRSRQIRYIARLDQTNPRGDVIVKERECVRALRHTHTFLLASYPSIRLSPKCVTLLI